MSGDGTSGDGSIGSTSNTSSKNDSSNNNSSNNDGSEERATKTNVNCENSNPISMLLTKRAIVVLLKATVVTWDRVRELAYQILISLKLPWVGFENVSDMIPIVEMALTLCGSPRRREYEAGAQILHMMYDRHVRVMGWSLLENHMTKYTSLKNRTTMNQKSNTSFIFFHRLCDILITRLQYQSKHILRKTTNNYKGDDASSLSSTTNSSFHGVHGLHGHGLTIQQHSLVK